MDIDLRQLRYITAVGQLQSFSRAAEVLRISQPALSRSIANFEAACGARLFDRTALGVIPTALGKPILAEMRALLNQADRMGRRVRQQAQGVAGSVAFGMGPIAASLIPGLLVTMAKDDPAIEVKVEVDSAKNLLASLKAERIEFFLCSLDLVPASRDLEVRTIGVVQLAFLARLGHPLADAGSIFMHDLLKYPLASGSPPEDVKPTEMESDALPHFSMVCDNFLALEDAVISSDMICLASPDLISKRNAGELTVLPVTGWTEDFREICVVSPSDRAKSPLATKLMDYLERTLKSSVAR